MLVINKKIENVFPLSPLQEGMLFHSMLDPSSSQYVIQNTYTLKMNINKEAVGKALNLLSQRYSVLRTAFVYENMKKPRQIVMHEKEILLIIHIWIHIQLKKNTMYCLLMILKEVLIYRRVHY